jgi:hypothetical protein
MNNKFIRIITTSIPQCNTQLEKAVQQNIYFGCFGNPIISDKPPCKCINTQHLINYKKYLFHNEQYKQLGLDREPFAIEGYYTFCIKK